MTNLPNYVGVIGEIAAFNYLTHLGYQVLFENYRCREGELDLIATDGSDLVFVEVKSSLRKDYIRLMESITPKKRSSLLLAAHDFMWREGIGSVPRCRFDIVCVYLPQGGEPEVHHVKNAFDIGQED